MPAATQDIWFENPAVGQRSRIVTLPGETGGRQFVLEYINRPWGGKNAVPPHVHSAYRETFDILKGRRTFLGSGESVRNAYPLFVTKAIYEGLLEVLDPTRRATRLQRELAAAAKAAVTVQEARDRRAMADRRRHDDRRQGILGNPTGAERRRGVDRRSRDRRSGG